MSEGGPVDDHAGDKAGHKRRRRRRINPMVFAAAGVFGVFGVMGTLVVLQLSQPVPSPQQEVQQVTVFRPPPPPPPPEEEPPPPPPEVEEEIETPEEPEAAEEEVADNEPPPGDLLGLDADGVAGGDAFGLAARRGGRSLLAGSGGGNGFLFGEVERAIQDRLAKVSELRAATYEVPAQISFSNDGCVERVSLQKSTGDQNWDKLLRSSVTGVCVKGRTTVEKLASRTVKLRIASR